jgi:sugar/nucleoside kinase (ribokinase family)
MSGKRTPYIVSMGMFILDEVQYEDGSGREPVYDIIGGAGTYAGLAARYFLSEEPDRVSLIIDRGRDFPVHVQNELDQWGCNIVYRDTPERLTTRGRNIYRENEKRDFEYVNPGIRIDVNDLTDAQLRTKVLHLICSPERCLNIITQLHERADKLGIGMPLLVWEPFPQECRPEKLPQFQEALKHVDVYSPNAEEAASLFGINEEPTDKQTIESLGNKYLPYLTKPNALMVLRCGAQGAVILTKSNTGEWFPAYHEHSDCVADPTGGGNSFLGGFALALVESDTSIRKAAIYGNVAAGLAIEQIGLPKLSHSGDVELWNGQSIDTRIQLYTQKLNK